MIRSASARPSATTESLSCSTDCARVIASGSSAPRSASSCRSSARLTTHDADIGIARADSTSRDISASLVLTSSTTGPSAAGEALGQPAPGRLGDQPGDVAAVRSHFLDQARREEGVERVGRHEHRLDAGQAMVHLRHLELVVEVADRPQALDDHLDRVGLAEVDDQPVEAVDDDVAVLLRRLAEHLGALLEGEHPLLRGVHADSDDDLVVQVAGAADDVEVAQGDGVEGPGADGASHDPVTLATRPAYQSVASP